MSKMKTAIMKWTLVQHSAYAFAGKPGFKHAVEEAMLNTEAQVAKVEKAGGLAFDHYPTDEEHAVNYPSEVQGLYPRVRGTFARAKIDDRAIYIPAKEVA